MGWLQVLWWETFSELVLNLWSVLSLNQPHCCTKTVISPSPVSCFIELKKKIPNICSFLNKRDSFFAMKWEKEKCLCKNQLLEDTWDWAPLQLPLLLYVGEKLFEQKSPLWAENCFGITADREQNSHHGSCFWMGKRRSFLKKNLFLTSFCGQWCQSRNEIASVTEVFLHISSGFAWGLWFAFKSHCFYCGYNWCHISCLNLTGDIDLISIALMCFPAQIW